MSESTPVKMPHCWKSHVVAQLLFFIYEYSFLCYSVPEYFSEYVETEDEEIFYILELELAKVSICTVIFRPRKPVLGVSHKVRFKPACSATETS